MAFSDSRACEEQIQWLCICYTEKCMNVIALDNKRSNQMAFILQKYITSTLFKQTIRHKEIYFRGKVHPKINNLLCHFKHALCFPKATLANYGSIIRNIVQQCLGVFFILS